MKEQIQKRTKQIGLEVIKLIDELPNKPSAWAIAKQIGRSSTSFGAIYRAACRAKWQSWAGKAGNNYRYFMVYERRTVDGAYKLEDFLNIIKDI